MTWSCNVFVFLELGTGWFGGLVSKKLGISRGMQIFFLFGEDLLRVFGVFDRRIWDITVTKTLISWDMLGPLGWSTVRPKSLPSGKLT